VSFLSEAKNLRTFLAPIPTETNQRRFASLNMTAPFKGRALSMVYDLQSARGKLQSAIVDASCRDKAAERRAKRTLSAPGH
jgi:hypothetical protein